MTQEGVGKEVGTSGGVASPSKQGTSSPGVAGEGSFSEEMEEVSNMSNGDATKKRKKVLD
ncbi:hypothetical protein GLAREA_13061 [Glarea lozoyensis ATCC 20868]|uniref:Uncharacterized protein n=1 Tax=Glarea lozoyensis (strain ATCC 20868 / MF5171) TaxID=1116229 RepID=S3DVD5_GLAL2|nr:uncharacterized protein GLAREA_13061 [Glarea lozoyensis ATCC 20868]EPE30338.1 hypothetical protein GLAREA_13061 [Glarea lozoyensis ATCC 20868]